MPSNDFGRPGALDVALTAIQMKKNRPGVLISVQARPADADRLETILFQETPTLGVRRTMVQRSVLSREPHAVQTRLGRVAGKIAYLPDGSARFTPEHDDASRLAKEHGISLAEAVALAVEAFRSARGGENK